MTTHTYPTINPATVLPHISQDDERAARIVRLNRWIGGDWLPDLRRDFQPAAVYDPIYDAVVVRFTVAGELWTAHAYETRPYMRMWRIRSPLPELYRDGRHDEIASMITQLVREYRAQVAALTALDAEQDAARDAALEAERAALWLWPHEHTVKLHRVSWCIGVGGNGDAIFDCGWSEQRSLWPDGRLELLDPSRAIYLMTGIHKPVFHEHVFTGIGSLPDELTQPRHTSFDDLVGIEPLVWVQRLVAEQD